MSWGATTLHRRKTRATETAIREARSWVVRLASGEVTVAEATAFRHWHAADALHAEAFAEAKLHWDVVGTATQDLASQHVFYRSRSARPGRIEISGPRRWFLGAGLATAAAGIGAVLIQPPFDLWSPVIDFTADYHTGIGERRQIDLAQDASVELTTRSRLALMTDGAEGLRVALLSGEAAITAGAHPVTVIAGPGQASAVHGRFDLRHDDDMVRVTCLAGTVEVACGDRTVSLATAQEVRYGKRGIGLAETIDPDVVTGWQRGILVFHNQPLSRVIAEINRYRNGRIILTNQDLANRPVAVANFHLDHLDEIVPQIEALYGVHGRYLPGGIVLLG